MDRHEINPSELDEIGSKLIASQRLSESEIDRIAGSPFLYSGVKARIGSVQQGRPAFGFGRRLTFTFGFGSLFVVIGIAAMGLFLLRGGDPNTAARQVHVPIPQRAQPVSYPSSDNGDMAALPDPVSARDRRTSPQYQNASFYRADVRSSTRRKPVPEPKPDLEFYPLAYAGDPKENVSGGRVLQVEMSRSSLFAMGFNIPIDNGAELVKADLLVGPDGLARGIRLH